jgi:2',3'-cyclic-nucleotide 2'-phosphodiesterase (5'-nucleotidase family)
MELMNYDALNLGSSELQMGKEFLEQSLSRVSFPFISSNLDYGSSKISSFRKYVIKETGGVTVAILGILDPVHLMTLTNPEQKGWQAMPPEVALQKLLPEVRQKADLVILLSQLSTARTLALVQAVKGIDVVISSGTNDLLNPKTTENTVLLHTGSRGMTLGMLQLTLDKNLVPRVTARSDIQLGNSVPDNTAIASLVAEHKKKLEAKKEIEKKKMTENLNLTPGQFMELYRKEQTEQGKGETK